jgi:hypothetical protein
VAALLLKAAEEDGPAIVGEVETLEPEIEQAIEDLLGSEVAETTGATYRIGSSDGGPGAWTQANESMGQDAAAYQEQVTGAPAGTVYNVANPNTASGITSFDGYDPASNTLIDAKFWNNWPISTGFSTQSVVTQATTQIQAANGANIIWYVPSQATATAVENILTAPQNGIPVGAIQVIVAPP